MGEAINERAAPPFLHQLQHQRSAPSVLWEPGGRRVDHHQTGTYKIARELQVEDIQVPSFLENLPDVRKEFAQYCNSTQRLDVSIGKVLDVLRASPEADNTIVVFTSDHGMPFPFSKATVYRNGTLTPALISWPSMGKPNSPAISISCPPCLT
ncbi:MAG: sulfatase-like hydrolase/transferase [Acidobacteriia bacterium]|nr:sulfatase-like hydrolase/transferase [Terriglobia bacterium]